MNVDFLPDSFIYIPGSLQDMRKGQPGSSDTSHDRPPDNRVRVVNQMEQVRLNK